MLRIQNNACELAVNPNQSISFTFRIMKVDVMCSQNHMKYKEHAQLLYVQHALSHIKAPFTQRHLRAKTQNFCCILAVCPKMEQCGHPCLCLHVDRKFLKNGNAH